MVLPLLSVLLLSISVVTSTTVSPPNVSRQPHQRGLCCGTDDRHNASNSHLKDIFPAFVSHKRKDNHHDYASSSRIFSLDAASTFSKIFNNDIVGRISSHKIHNYGNINHFKSIPHNRSHTVYSNFNFHFPERIWRQSSQNDWNNVIKSKHSDPRFNNVIHHENGVPRKSNYAIRKRSENNDSKEATVKGIKGCHDTTPCTAGAHRTPRASNGHRHRHHDSRAQRMERIGANNIHRTHEKPTKPYVSTYSYIKNDYHFHQTCRMK